MKITHALVSTAILFSPLAGLIAAPAHVHGAAKMDISVDGDKLSIGLEMPLDSLLGFERPPRTDKEKLSLASTIKTLKNATAIFVTTAAAACRVESVEVSDPFPDGKVKTDGHADIDADYLFRCTKPAALKSLETKLFTQFKRLHKIEVQRATPNGQGKTSMTPESPSLSW